MKYLLFISLSVFLLSCAEEETAIDNISAENVLPQTEDTIEIVPRERYNLNFDNFEVIEKKIQKGEVLSEILYPRGIDYPSIQKLADLSKDVFSVKKLQADKPYTLLLNKDSIESLAYMIYEIDAVNYVVYDFNDSIRVYKEQKPVNIVERTASGIIESSLWQTAMDNNLNQELIMTLSDVYAWTIDFYHLQKGDAFKVIYKERQVEGKMVGVEMILAAEFVHHGSAISAYLFEQDDIPDYFDDEGKSLRKAFLRAPVKFSRISSRFTKKRFHPVQKRYKAHLGTDYAAPSGTPIIATGDGVVVASTYKKFNGNYVKIQHNSTYTTQYLHMSKRAVKNGERVMQGQVIGYVGSTGLASGPHVCYRFWKNGKQVDPFRQKLPETKPINPEDMDDFEKVKGLYSPRLKSIIPLETPTNSIAGS